MKRGRNLSIVSVVALILGAGIAFAQPPAPEPRPFPEFREIPRTSPPAPVDAATQSRRRLFSYDMRVDQSERMIATGERILEDVRQAVARPNPPPTSRAYNEIVLRNMPGILEIERKVVEAATVARQATVAAEEARLAHAAGRMTKAEYDRLEARRAEADATAAAVSAEQRRLHRANNVEQDVARQKQQGEMDARMAEMRERQREMAKRIPSLAATVERAERSARDSEAQRAATDANRRAMEVYADAREAAVKEAAGYTRVADTVKAGARPAGDLAAATAALKAAQTAMFDAREALYASQLESHRLYAARREAAIAEREAAIRASEGEARVLELRKERIAIEQEVAAMRALQDRKTREADFKGAMEATSRMAAAQQRLMNVYGPAVPWISIPWPPALPPERPAVLPVIPTATVMVSEYSVFDWPRRE